MPKHLAMPEFVCYLHPDSYDKILLKGDQSTVSSICLVVTPALVQAATPTVCDLKILIYIYSSILHGLYATWAIKEEVTRSR